MRTPRGKCFKWTGSITKFGYGIIWQTRDKFKMAHRVVYEGLHGKIKNGLTLDHLCRNRACVNPKHLEPVTSRENTMRGIGITARNAKKVRCKHGHKKWRHFKRTKGDQRRECIKCRNVIRRRHKNASKKP